MVVIIPRDAKSKAQNKRGRAGVGLVSSVKGSSDHHPLSTAICKILDEVMRRAGLSRKEKRQWEEGKLSTHEVVRRMRVRDWNDTRLLLREKQRRGEITRDEETNLKVVSSLLEVEPILEKFAYHTDASELGKWGRLSEEQRTNIAFVYLFQVYNYGGKEGRPAAAMALRAHPEFREIYREHGLTDKDIDEFIRSG